MSVLHQTPLFPRGTSREVVFNYYFHFDFEFSQLVDDLGLIPLSSPEAQAVLSAYSNRDRFLEMDFEDELRDFYSPNYPNLLQVYAKHNSKGSRRSYGTSLAYQLTLPL